jgi:hypothetical protein
MIVISSCRSVSIYDVKTRTAHYTSSYDDYSNLVILEGKQTNKRDNALRINITTLFLPV